MTRTALVTGGNRGIGLAIVKGLAHEGYRVLLGSRDIGAGQSAAAHVSGDVHAVALDLSDRALLGRQMDEIMTQYPEIDVLINNAGVLFGEDIFSVSEADFDLSVRVNLAAPFDLCRILIPHMERRGYGRVVNVSSGWGSFGEGLEGPAAYAVTKAALNALTLKFGQSTTEAIKVNAMCPGWVRTRMGGESATRSPEEGADTAIWLAMLDDEGPSGGIFRDRKPISW